MLKYIYAGSPLYLPERARLRNVHAARATWVGEQRETTRAGAAASQGTRPFALVVAAGILSYPYKGSR